MTSVYEHIAAARQTLIASGVERDAAGIDAEVLARHALSWDRAKLIADGRGPAPDTFVARYAPLVDRRSRREPVAMITGRREFWGLDFEVTPDVLIPRPESELIVEAVCARRRDGWPARILDVGTGSGCLAVALAHELPDARLVATDISAAALTVAARNAARHGVAGRIQFVRGNFLAPIAGPVDVVVSNPPYVPANVQLSPDITYYEPAVALYSGLEGLDAVQQVIATAAGVLAPGGLLVFEFGLGQDDRIEDLARRAGWRSVAFEHDLQGIARTALLEI